MFPIKIKFSTGCERIILYIDGLPQGKMFSIIETNLVVDPRCQHPEVECIVDNNDQLTAIICRVCGYKSTTIDPIVLAVWNEGVSMYKEEY
jgi:hypothetical protein